MYITFIAFYNVEKSCDNKHLTLVVI